MDLVVLNSVGCELMETNTESCALKWLAWVSHWQEPRAGVVMISAVNLTGSRMT